ncbi:hypothetical protein AMAG_15221 [Allomyces macrogynus ATCC 38327]|uniref:Galactose oxidase n=1 Tax=Allomyces macrogynus (strain ATCC 38327) TaxID=578462 RepID=A0A0L0T8A7_ALLM3|nr:hypothetical protein AMAG_15221 [Allomyces macrogynus ATCC 38327]|eukprot:KNE70957.1 hypothetical protein AMAG_15221 [Allomyces macrogynus ATCC 38327]
MAAALSMPRIAAVTILLLLAATAAVKGADFTMDKTKSTSGSACAVVDNRLYALGGYLATAGETKSSMAKGIYSIDLSQPFSTNDPPVTSHGVIDASVSGLVDMNAVVLGDSKILIASGTGPKDINNSTYIFNPTDNSITPGSDIKSGRYPHPSSMANAATAADKYSAVPIYGGIQEDKSHASSMLLVTSSSSSLVTSRPADLVPREFASVMRFNGSQLLVSGGFGDDYQKDSWLFNEASQTWTKAKWMMTMGRYFHRSVLYGSKPYLITVGGYSSAKPYTLVESVDLSANSPTSSAGTIVNAGDGPKSMVSGCMTLVGDTLIYLGGNSANDAGTNFGPYLPLVSLLKIETANNGLQFRWITDFKPASSSSSAKSGSGSSNGGPDSNSSASSSAAGNSDKGSVTTESSGLSTGAIIGIAISAAVVGAVAVFGVLQYRRRQQIPDAPKPVQPAPAPPAEPAQQNMYAQSQAYAQAQNAYVQPQPTWTQPQQPQQQPTWANQQPQFNGPSYVAMPVPPTPSTPTVLSEPTTLVSSTGVGYLMDPDTMQRPQSSVSGAGAGYVLHK